MSKKDEVVSIPEDLKAWAEGQIGADQTSLVIGLMETAGEHYETMRALILDDKPEDFMDYFKTLSINEAAMVVAYSFLKAELKK